MWQWEAVGESKAVIVMVHGAMEHHRRYQWLIDKWRLAGFHVVMGDLPGQGMATSSRKGHITTFNEYLIEVKKWIRAAKQLNLPVFLLGHSMGGLIVIRLLQEERIDIDGVILSSPCLGLVTYPAKLLNGISIGLNVVIPSLKMNSGISVEMATRNEEVRIVDKNDPLYVKKVSIRWYRELLKAMRLAFSQIDQVQDIPILVMQASEDKIVDKQVVKEWVNNVPLSEKSFKEWVNCYHEIYNEPERETIFEYGKDFVVGLLTSKGYSIK
jgi:lysophospholipase